MIKQAGIDFADLEDSEPDHILGDYTGAGTIFGATGGVMEAALRTAYHYITEEELPDDAVEFHAVRGLKGVKEAEIEVAGRPVRIAVAHGLGNVGKVLDKVREARQKNQEPPYHFVEVMACPGGCVAGGGQPYGVTDGLRAKRIAGLYAEDAELERRKSHLNPHVQQLYKEYLGEPLGDMSHQLLHTHYSPRPLYQR